MSSAPLTESLRETLAVFEETGTPQTTTEVASTLDLGRRSTYDRLQRLVDRDRLATKKVGASARVWWQPTEREASERELRRRETLFEQSRDVNAVVDSEGRFQLVTASAETVLGHAPDNLVGDIGYEYVHPEDRGMVKREFAAMVEDPTYEPTVEFRFAHSDGHWVALEARARNLIDDPDIAGIVVYTRDVTARNRRERELHQQVRQQEVITALGQHALDRHDLDALMTEASRLVADTLDNDYCKVLDLDADGEQLHLRAGVGWNEGIVGSATVSAVDDDSQAAYTLGTSEPVVVEDLTTETRFSGPALLTDHDVRSGISVLIGTPADPWGILGTHDTETTTFADHEVTFVQSVANVLAGALDRQAYEQKLVSQRRVLETQERALRRASEVMSRADHPLSTQLEDLLGVLGETLGADYTGLATVSDGTWVFETVDVLSDATIQDGDSVPDAVRSDCARASETGQRVVIEPDDGQAVLGVPVGVDGETDGVLCCCRETDDSTSVTDWEIAFAELVANWIRGEYQRQQYTDRLAALNELNTVAREITDAVIDQSTRAEIEQSVCNRLAATDSYQFAWVGDVDTASTTVTPRVEAGAGDYLDDITISVDPDDERSDGPTGRALRTGEMQVVQDTRRDDSHDPWRSHVRNYDFRSSAAVPIVHDDVVYGVLNVYARRPHAFEEQEATVLGQLGEVVGHAIAATERKQALMGDEIVELEFQIPDFDGLFDVDISVPGRIELRHAVPVAADTYLIYGTASAEAAAGLQTLVEAVPHWQTLTLRAGDDVRQFELRVSEPPVLSAVASAGGAIDRAVVEDGDFHLSLHVSPEADVRGIIDVVSDAYPSAELLKRHQQARETETGASFQRVLTTTLTDRQRATLRAAYHAGFFEWPRDVSGTDMAGSLGVSPPTFHQHLRKAERKVFETLLSGEVPLA